VSHNHGNPYEKWNIFVARPHLWLQLGMVKPEIILSEAVLNLSTLNTLTYLLTYLLTNVVTSHVSRSLMVSVGVSALWATSIHFIERGVKVNGQYYREDLLMQKRLPDIRQLSDFYVFQQVSRSVRWSHVFYSCTSCVLSLCDAVGVCGTYLVSLESAQIAYTCLPWPAGKL